jgi:hypothetical protein
MLLNRLIFELRMRRIARMLVLLDAAATRR